MDSLNSVMQLAFACRDNPEMGNLWPYQFAGRCLTYANQSKSQYFQDIWVLHETNFKYGGYFVEFGATDGKNISNTFLLEKTYNWDGILAEPNPAWHRDLKINRICNISTDCVYTHNRDVEFTLPKDYDDLATVSGYGMNDEHAWRRANHTKTLVPSITLHDLLMRYKAPTYIDYMSVDTEGTEFDILEKFFKDNVAYEYFQYYIKMISIEHNYIQTEREKIYQLMRENGYERRFSIGCDDLYIRI